VLLNDITGRRFRWNPLYSFQTIDHWTGSDPAIPADVANNPEVAAILSPASSKLSTQLAGAKIAMLREALSTPTRLSDQLLSSFSQSADCNALLAVLVLDQVIEIESDEGFLSGPDAHGAVFGARSLPAPDDVLSRLSIAGVKYGQEIGLDDPIRLSVRLYCFNRAPASPVWKSKLSSPDRVLEFLGLGANGVNRERLDGHWIRSEGEHALAGWSSWRFKNARVRSRESLGYKLYVSPRCEYLPEALGVTIEALTEIEAPRFKIGCDIFGVLRPDKLVAYFSHRAAMMEAGRRILAQLSTMPAHGVPFTCGMDPSGLVSWGMDPPEHARPFRWNGKSWRFWVTERLATALIAASRHDSKVIEPWEFALDRVCLDGIDTRMWGPYPGLWQDTGARGLRD
jgi:hypothetical protein